jgi:stage IV sporulation protein FB
MKSLDFRLLGFPVMVHPIAWLVLGFILLSRASGGPSALVEGALWAVVLFGSILVHELGHALVARGFRLGPVQITIHGFGGLTTHRRSPSPGRSMLVTAAGPGAGLLLGGLALALYLPLAFSGLTEGASPSSPVGLLDSLLYMLVAVNIFWSLFNLLPMAPLDGGQLLDSGLVLLGVKPMVAYRTVAIISIAFAVLVGIAALYTGMWFLIFVAFLVLQRNLPALGVGGGPRRY